MNSKLAPLSGIAFLVFVIAGGLYGGEPPSEQGLKSPEELAAASPSSARTAPAC